MQPIEAKKTVDDVLHEISSSGIPPDRTKFRRFLAQYPEFKSEIVDFVTAWIEMEAIPDTYEMTDTTVDRVVNRTMSRVQQLLHRPEDPTPLASLSKEIRATGHDLHSFELAVGIDREMLTSLDNRLINPASIPALLVERIASALCRSAESVRTYLRLHPQQAAAYMASRFPALSQIDFAEAVRESTLSETKKAFWLAKSPDPLLSE